MSTLERVDVAAWGLPPELREGARLQRRIGLHPEGKADFSVSVLYSRRGRRRFPINEIQSTGIPQDWISLIVKRLRALFALAGHTIDMGALRVRVLCLRAAGLDKAHKCVDSGVARSVDTTLVTCFCCIVLAGVFTVAISAQAILAHEVGLPAHVAVHPPRSTWQPW